MTEKKVTGSIKRIVGPVVEAKNMRGARIFDVVRVGKEQLLGEIIRLEEDTATIQVYEETASLQPKEPVISTGLPLSVELGPGILTQVYDGVQRPLDLIKKQSGTFIERGIQVEPIDKKKKWGFKPTIKNGDSVSGGHIIGTVKETSLITHYVMVPHGVEGKISGLHEGQYTVEQTIAKVGGTNISMLQRWPVKQGRPYKNKLAPDVLLVSGQRVIDFFFPLPKGAAGCIPGPFGAGKTVTQQTLAKWVDADIIVYVGCGERGNEMTDVLYEFPQLKDPKSGKPLMERTILVANTSNMPVAAREASIYTGMTIAEYYRDMGYDVALMADSTSRWAEAMREISGRLEEMPGEEGYPAYLGTRLASFYERAGRVTTQSEKTGSVTAIGAVSPPGGDFSEPVTQNTLRIAKVFWGLDSGLASKRHFPSINWLNSYSLYFDQLDPWFEKNAGKDWPKMRVAATNLLQKEAELQEIVQIVGPDALPEKEKVVLDVSRMIREDFLQQNAFHEVDTYCSLDKQRSIMKVILDFYNNTQQLEKVDSEKLVALSCVADIAKLKYVEEKNFKEEFEKLEQKMKHEFEVYEKTMEVSA